jgi:hypothetical protein
MKPSQDSAVMQELGQVAARIRDLASYREALVERALAEGHSGAAVSRAAGWGRTTLQMRQKRGVSAIRKPQDYVRVRP